jgi:hypothetical protein
MRTINIKSLAGSMPAAVSFENFCDKPAELIALESLADSLANIGLGIEDYSPVAVVAKGLVQGRISNEDGKQVAIIAAIVAAVSGLLYWVYKKLRGDKDIAGSLSRISAGCDDVKANADAAAGKTEAELAAAASAEVSLVAADPAVAAAAAKLAVPDTQELKNISAKLHSLASSASADANSEATLKAIQDLEEELTKRSDAQVAGLKELAKSLSLNIDIDPSNPESFSAAISKINAEMKGKKKVIDNKIIRDIMNGGATLKHNADLISTKVAALNKAADNINQVADAQQKIAKEMEKIQQGGPILSAFKRASSKIRSMMGGVMLVTSTSGMYISDTDKVLKLASQ